MIGIGIGLFFSLWRVIIIELTPADFRGIIISFGETAKGAGATFAPLFMGIVFILLQSHYELVFSLRLTNALFGFIAIVVGIYLSYISVKVKPVQIEIQTF